jgi:predicted outer membrane protein
MKLHLCLTLFSVLALATGGGGSLLRADEKPVTDVDFLAEAITHAACEVKASELALTRAKAKAVQQLARKILAQQRKLDPPLHRLARDTKVPVLFNQTEGEKRCESRLAKLRGEPFDRELLKLLTRDLEQWIDLAKRSAAGGNLDERDLATRMLPTLRHRLQEVTRLVKSTGRSRAVEGD